MKYKASDIEVLNAIQHVQLNPGMYISRTTDPCHLIEEPFDNALDEALAGYANIIAINIDTKKHIYSVLDNGRGIPISGDTPITVSTKLFSGAKFKDRKTAYKIVSGMHGVGLVTVLALSKKYSVEIYRNGRHGLFEFEKAKLKSKKIVKNKETPYSTKIQFTPDKKYFEKIIPDLDRIRERLYSASAELPNCTFILQIDDEKEVISLTKDSYFKNYCLNKDSEISSVIDIKAEEKIESFEVKFCHALKGAITPKFISSINILPVSDGGTHVNMFYDVIKDFFSSKAKKLGYIFQPQDSLCGLRTYFSLRLVTPEFSGQTKDKLINRKTYLDKLIKKVRVSLEEFFEKDKELLEDLLEKFQDYRKKIDASKLKGKSNGKRASTKFTKLRECTSAHGELFIVEGESAGGGLVRCRDPRKHAIFPLKGKIPSIVNTKDILKHKEIGELIMSLGTGVGPHFDIENLKYDKIICATDADDDGCHIFVLLTMALAVLTPEIIKQGKYYLAVSPLYAINEKKSFIPLWDEKDLEKAKKDKKHITRFKGLGELNPNQLFISVVDINTRNLIQVEYSENIEELLKLLSEVSAKRKLLES